MVVLVSWCEMQIFVCRGAWCVLVERHDGRVRGKVF